ncbi:hypothetical protein E8M01_16370 [Phreatobacter stygius]|uniref:Uncharacterized protein n=1 Tax=Phreatobacter stygius TaxID=1940610 RepID=A0A4D7BHT9_9HYPH|nr:hypothetical protein E8M01_16370 [Phreatobacter stygius]
MRTVAVSAPVPATARQPCVPAPVPDRELSAREVTSLWGRDRITIRVCDTRRLLAVDAADTAASPLADRP